MTTVEPDTRTSGPDADEGHVAHIIRREDELPGYVWGQQIQSLCGLWFTPTRDPYKFPVCHACRDALTAMP